MSLSIKVSELTVLSQITHDDYIIVNDSGSVTTKRATFDTLGDYLSGSNKPIGSASYTTVAEFARLARSSSYASSSLSSSYSVSSSYARNSTSSSYSRSGSYADKAALADSVVGGTGWSNNSLSASYSSASLSSSYGLSSSYARSSSFSDRSYTSSYATSASSVASSDWSKYVYINGREYLDVPETTVHANPYYQWLTMWSGSYTGKLARTNIADLGVQYNIGKPLVFQDLIDSSQGEDSANGLTPLLHPYIELRPQNSYGVYRPWLILSYLYTGGFGSPPYTTNPTGSFGPDTGPGGWRDPSAMPPGNPYTRNLRIIPNYDPNFGLNSGNFLDETSMGSQQFTLYNRSTRNFAWYQGGSFFGHRPEELDPGISGSCRMVLAGGRLGLGQFGSGSQRDVGTANPTPPIYPLAPLHISASEGAMNDTNTPLVRLDQKVGTAGTIGSLQGWIRININGVAYKMPLYN